MQTLLDGVSANGASSGVAVNGPCNVIIAGDSVFDGASVAIESYPTDTDAKYAPAGLDGFLKGPDSVFINGVGDYFVRAVVRNAGSSTNINAVINQ